MLLLLGGQPSEDVTKLKKIRVPELNKYLNDHGLKQHLKSSKSEKVKANSIRHSCLQQKSPLRAGQTTLRNARTLSQNYNRASAESRKTDESNAIDSGGEDDSNDVILAFINLDEKDAKGKPNTTRSGRAITRRSEIDSSFF